MFGKPHHPNNHSHIQPLNITPQLVRTELILVHNVQIQAAQQRIVRRFNMIHLLIEPTHQGPKLLIRQLRYQR